MLIDIEQIYTYGRFYPDIKDHVNWWFCTTDYGVYDTATIISNFGFADEKSIANVDVFIPFFKSNIIDLEKCFLHTILPDGCKHPFPYENILTFDRDFKIYIETHGLIRDWYTFEKKHLCHDAISWCKLHNIRFR